MLAQGTPPVVLAYENLNDSEKAVWNAIESGRALRRRDP
jgi:hypothetical protein